MIRLMCAVAALLTGCATAAHEPSSTLTPAQQAMITDFPQAPVSPPLPTGPISTIVLASCLNEEWNREQDILRLMTAQRADLALLLGDNVYGSGTSGDPLLSDLRAAYAQQAQRTDFRNLVAATPTIAIWDDHDFGKNDGGGEDFPQRALAQAMFDAFWRIGEGHPQSHPNGVYGAWTFGPNGQRVQLIALDTRYWRSPLKPTDQRDAPGKERYLADEDPAKTMLGAAQWAWLEQQLKQPADLRIIASSVQVTAEAHGWEKWGNFPHEKRRLYDLIARTGAKGVVFVSGDRHASAINREQPAGLSYPLYDLTASSVNMPWSASTEELPGNRITPMYGRENYSLIRIDWAARSLTLETRDRQDQPVFTHVIPFAEIGA